MSGQRVQVLCTSEVLSGLQPDAFQTPTKQQVMCATQAGKLQEVAEPDHGTKKQFCRKVEHGCCFLAMSSTHMTMFQLAMSSGVYHS